MGTERAWEKYTSKNVQKKTEKPQREWEKYTSFSGGGISERVADWVSQHDQYVANSQKRYSDRKFDYTDNYVSDSQEWFEKTNTDRLALQAEADSIMEYMKANQKSLDPRWAAQVQQMLRNGLNQQKSLADTAYQDYDWWRSFGDQKQYGQYGSAEEAYKASQRMDSYQKKYSGLKHDDIQKTIETLEDGEEKLWLQDKQYELYQSDPEYTSKAKSGRKSYDAQKIVEQQKKNDKTWWEQVAESFAYSSADTSLPAANLSNAQAAYRNDNSYREPNDKWTDEQWNEFGYLYAESPSKAFAYAEQINRLITDQEESAARERIGANASKNVGTGVLNTLGAIATAPLGLADYLDNLVEYSARGTITNDGVLSPFEYSQAATSGIADKLNSYGTIDEDKFMIGGKGWGDVYSLGVSAANSLVSAYTLGGTGTLVNFIGQGGASGVDEALERGANPGQALLYGSIVGAAEGLTESINADKLIKIGSASTLKRYLLNALNQGIGESVEEGASSLIGNIADNIVMRDKSNFNVMVKEFMDADPNMTKEEAEKKAWLRMVGDVAFDAMGGFVTGSTNAMTVGGVQTAIDSSKKNQKNIDALKQYGEQTGTLIQEGLKSDKKSDSYKLATKYQEQTQGTKKKAAKALTGAQIRNLLAANQDQIKPKDMKLIQEAAKKRLTELGQTGDLDNLAALATKYATGGTLTKAERSTLVRTNYGARVANELIPQNITADSWAADIGTEMVNADAYNMKKVRDTIQEIIDREINMQDPESYQSLDERIGKDQIENAAQQVSGTGKAVIRDTGKEIDLSNPSIARFTEDGAVLNVNGEEVSTEDIDFESVDQALAFTAVSKIEHITPAHASALLSTVNMKKPVGEQLNGLDEAYTYGYYGYSEKDLKAGSFTGSLTQVQLNDAYKLGQLAGKQKAEADTANIKKMVTEGAKTAGADNYFDFVQQTFREYDDTDISAEEYQNVLLEKRSQWREKKNASKTKAPAAKITYNHGGGVVEDISTAEKSLGKLNAQQRGGIEAIKILQQLGIGGDYELFASYKSKTMKDENGKPMEVFLDDNGEEVPAYAGLYTMADGKIRININAYSGTKGLTLNALSHELTHFIKQWSPDKYKALAEYLIKTYEGTDMTMHKRVVREQNRLKEIRKEDVSYDEAYDEVVANAFNRLLEDGKVMERIAEIRQMDKSLADKIIERIRDFIKRFTNAYRKNPSYFRDSEALMEMKEAVDQLQELFAEALVEASDNFRAAEKNTTGDGGMKYSQQYIEADTNSGILSLTSRVYDGEFKPNEKVFLGTVSNSIAERIYNLTGIRVNGFKVAIEARQIDHILKDHGKNGESDHSMANPIDIAKMEYVLVEPDDISKSGKTQAYTYMRNGRNRTADTVLYEKKIGTKSYYVVQAVPDTKAKTLYVVTAFIGNSGYKKEASQLINAKSPDATAKTGSVNASTDSISIENKTVKDYSGTNSDTRYSTQQTDNISDRELLANAFENLAQNSEEYKMLQEYKDMASTLTRLDQKLQNINQQIRDIRFSKGQRDNDKLARLEAKANRVLKDITRYDKQLVNMEKAAPLRRVIQMEKKKSRKKTLEHVEEILQNRKERAERAELRQKIRRSVRDLNKILTKGNKQRNVKEDMKGFATKALELADFLFTDHISDDDLIRKGITVRMDPSDAALVKETEQILFKLYDHADSLSDEEFTKLDEQRKKNEENLRDLLTDQRNEYLGTSVYQLFEDLVLEYAKMNDSDQPSVKATYDPDVERFLRSYIGQTEGGTDTERVTLLNNMRVKDMTLEELDLLYKAYSMVLHSIRNANKLHAEGMKATVEETTSAIIDDISGKKRPKKGNEARIRNLANKIGWDYEKLYYALDRIGSDTFTQLILNIADGENIVMRDVIEAKAFLDGTVQKHGYNDWAVNKKLDRTFLDNTGKEFELTLGEIMYLYAFSKRADSDIEKKRANRKKGLWDEENETEGTAWDHLEYGGFSFNEADLKDPNPADTYRLTREQCIAITDLLTAEQKAYVDDVQRYLSTTMGEKGNEVSLKLYGIRMYEEKYYIPILTAGIYKAKAQESQAKAQAGFSTMSNAGFTKSRDTKAKSPIVLQGFMEIAAGHINEMSRYHGMVPALEDYRKVTNYSEYFDKGTDSVSFRSAMINAFGKNAMDYFDNLYREANSGAIVDKMEQKQKKLLSLFRKGSVAYSLSVLVQQPASLMRAYALINPKYFGLHGIGAIPSGIYKAATSRWNTAYKDAYKEMLQYAPGVTMAKEIGGFDAATGNSIYSYLLDTNKNFFQSMKTGNAKEVAGTFANKIDDNFVANLPNVADKIAWIEIWNACKRETIAKNHSLSPTSTEFMEKVGKRFTEVIQATQVYDSIFSKSPLMKSRRLSVQMAVSFMNEPNTVSNMLESAIRAAARGDWKKSGQTIGAVVWSSVVTTILKSVVYAMRDEDENETWLEKYVNSVTGNLANDLVPFLNRPFVRDIWSAVQGYDIERADMAVIADAIKAIRRVSTVRGKDTSEMTEDQLIKHEQEVTKATWKAIEAVLNVFGVPLKNLRRDVNAVLDTMGRIFNPKGDTTLTSIWDQVQIGVSETIPFLSTEPKSQRLYDAIKENDTAYLERLKRGYKDESAYNSAVRKALREHDGRIQEAAQAYYSGDRKNYERLFKQIRADHFDYDNIFAAIQSEVSDIKDGKEPKKENSRYSSSDFVGAIVSGDPVKAEEIREYIIDYKVRNGDTLEEAEASFRTSVVSGTKSEYVDGMFTRNEAADVLRNYSGMDTEEANAKIRYWDFQIDYPEYDDLSQKAVENYLELAEPAKLSLSVYADFLEQKSAFETVKEDGETVTTVQDQVIELLTDMQLTEAQRLALWLSAGYKESTYVKVDW